MFERRTTANSSPATSYADKTTAADLKTLPKSSSEPGGTAEPSAALPSNENPAGITSPKTSGNPADDARVCERNLSKLMDEFNRDVEKQKRSLDDKLSSFHVGLNISSMYVEDYNSQVVKLLEKHAASAAALGCVLPVSSAPVLPPTYPY